MMLVLATPFPHLHPSQLYWPELGGVIAALVFGVVFGSRALQYVAVSCLLVVASGIAVIDAAAPPTGALTGVAAGLVGIGVGSSLSSRLLAGRFAQRSGGGNRVSALSELRHPVAALVIAPLLVHLALTAEGTPDAGTSIILWIGFGLTVAGALLGASLYAFARVRASGAVLKRSMRAGAGSSVAVRAASLPPDPATSRRHRPGGLRGRMTRRRPGGRSYAAWA